MAATDVAPSMILSPVRSKPNSPRPQSQPSSSPPPQPPLETVIENRIFVGGIPSHANVNELRTFLAEKFNKAEIKDIKIISDKTGVSKGYGFVTFETRDMAQAILNSSEYDNIIFKDRKLNISKAVKKLSTKLEHGGSSGGGGNAGVPGATAAFLPDSAAAAPVQYLLYRRPDSGIGQLLTALPFGYCTPIYLSGTPQLPLFSAAPGPLGAAQIIAAAPAATAAASTSTVCPTTACSTTATLQWPTAAAAMPLDAASATAAAQLLASSLPACFTAAGGNSTGTAAAFGQNGELLYYSLPALAAAAAAASAAASTASNTSVANSSASGSGAPGSRSEFGTGSDPTDNGTDLPASSIDNGICGGLGIYGIIGSPVRKSFKAASAANFDYFGSPSTPHTAQSCCFMSGGRNCNVASSVSTVASSGFNQQPQGQQVPKQEQQQLMDCSDLLFGGIGPFGEPRHDFSKFLDHRV